MQIEQDFSLDHWEAAVGKIVTSIARVEGELLLKYEEYFSRSKYFRKDKELNIRLERIEALHNELCGKTQHSEKLFFEIKE